MPQDHRTSKEDFPLAEAKRLRAEGQSIQAVADAIGWSFAQTRRKLLASTEPASANATQTKVQPANPATPTTEKIPIADIIVDARTQMRQSLNLSTIAEYTEAMEEGSKFPPIVVFSDGGATGLPMASSASKPRRSSAIVISKPRCAQEHCGTPSCMPVAPMLPTANDGLMPINASPS